MKSERLYYPWETVGEDQEMDFLRGGITKLHTYYKREGSYVTYERRHLGRLDLLANEVYENPFLWWVISLANDIVDPFDNALVGSLIFIPNIMDVFEFYDDNYVTPPTE